MFVCRQMRTPYVLYRPVERRADLSVSVLVECQIEDNSIPPETGWPERRIRMGYAATPKNYRQACLIISHGRQSGRGMYAWIRDGSVGCSAETRLSAVLFHKTLWELGR